MTQEQFDLASVSLKLDRVLSLMADMRVEREKSDEPVPAFLSLADACALKGGCAYETCRARWWLHPCAGTNSVKVGGKKCWRRDDVLEWLDVTDDRLADYARKFGVTLPKK